MICFAAACDRQIRFAPAQVSVLRETEHRFVFDRVPVGIDG
jgi:hypothetical protein